MLSVKMVRAYKTNYPYVMNAINKKFLYEAGAYMQGQTIDRVPVDSGRLKNSIKYKVNLSQDNVGIGTNVEYAPYVEYGTKKMPAQSYLRTALDSNRRNLRQLWVSLFRKTFKAMGRL